MRDLGVVTSCSGDWTLATVLPIFSAVLGIHGISAAFLGKWQEKVGPRVSCTLGAFFYGGGLILGGIGVLNHNLPLLYLGAGLCAGLGLGLSYVPPISTLVKWFPNNRGLATGLTIMGFGGGALVTTPIQSMLIRKFSEAPTYVGNDSSQIVMVEGKRFIEYSGELREVVYATANDLAINFPELVEGFYLTSTGSTGAGLTLVCMGSGFFVCMLASALMFRVYPTQPVINQSTTPAINSVSTTTTGAPVFAVHFQEAMKTPQFWQIWLIFASLASSGLATISVSKTMIADIFVNQYPLIVTGGFTSACVMVFSVANLFGRLYWSSLSDRVGRLNIFKLFTLASVPLYLSIPLICSYLPYTTSAIPLAIFLASSSIIFSFFGGIYSVCPAFESDLFGSKYFGAIHGRMLTASAFGAISGPIVLAKLREMSEISAIKDLASKVSPDLFLERFGAPISNLDSLISTKVVTISELLSILPSDVIDPSPFLYNTTMYTAATLVSLAAVITFSIKPVDPKYYEKPPTIQSPTLQSSTIQSIDISQPLKKNEEVIGKVVNSNEVNQKKNIE